MNSLMSPSFSSITETTFETSKGLPPPTATMRVGENSFTSLRTSSAFSTVGSSFTRGKTLTSPSICSEIFFVYPKETADEPQITAVLLVSKFRYEISSDSLFTAFLPKTTLVGIKCLIVHPVEILIDLIE
jgi:hypothetical protein